MDIAAAHLDYEICLSRRADLIAAVLDRVLQARIPKCADTGFRVCAHEANNAALVTLRFLIVQEGAADLRNRLIVGGEMLLDQLFAASPWQSAPLVAAAVPKRAVRPEIHVKCRPTDDETWYAGGGVRAAFPATLWRLTTGLLRATSLRRCEIKNVLPVLIHRCRTGYEGSDWPEWAFSPATDDEARSALKQRALALHKRGEIVLAPEALDAGERRQLGELERYINDARKLVGEVGAPAALRFVLAQMGFSDVEADYAIVLGLVDGKDPVPAREAA